MICYGSDRSDHGQVIPMKFNKINRATASEIIVREILSGIDSGQIKPGDKLPSERELSEQFGVCRASVREASRALTLMGYLEVFQGKGAFLKEILPRDGLSTDRLDQALSAADSLDLIDIRNLLECKSVALAALRATPAQLAEVEAAVIKMETGQGDLAAFYDADREFHQALALASNNQVLIEITALIGERMIEDRDRFLGFYNGDRGACRGSARAVYQAVADGDGERAVTEMTAHLSLVNDEVFSIINRQ